MQAQEGIKAVVLVVEDNPVNQIIAQENLEALGCEVDVADDGEEGVRAWSLRDYDLVCMDCAMPRMDGFEATRVIREKERERGCRTTIVAITAHIRQEDRNECIEAGMDDFMTKPYTQEELKEMLEKWLKAIPGI